MNWLHAIHKKIFWLLLIYPFFGIISAIQQAVFGQLLFRQQMIDLLVIGGIAVYGFLLFFTPQRIIRAPFVLFVGYLLYLIYTLFSVLFLFRFAYSITYIIYVAYYMSAYSFAFFVLMIGFEGQELTAKETWLLHIQTFFNRLMLPLFLLACVQFVFQNSFLTISGNEGKSLMARSELLGTYRPPAIFTSSYEFGLYACFSWILLSATILMGNRKIGTWILFVVSFASILLTQTRNIYVFACCAFLSLWVLRKHQGLWLPRVLPWLFILLISVGLFGFSMMSLQGDVGNGLSDSASTLIRFTYLQRIYDGLVLKSSWTNILFGWGLIQHAGDASIIHLFPPIYNDDDGTLGMDNMLVSIFMYQGLIGLVLYFVVYMFMLTHLLRIARTSKHPFVQGFTAFYMAFPGAGVFNLVNIGTWGIFTSFFAISIIALYHTHDQRSHRIVS